jgi:hypothetical protein
MSEIFINVVSAVLAAVVIGWLGLNKGSKQTVVVDRRRVGWFWKVLVLGGGFLFYYGLLVFLGNLTAGGMASNGTAIGIAMTTWGAFLWFIGRVVIFFKRD